MPRTTDQAYADAIEIMSDLQQDAYAEADAQNKEWERVHPADEDNPTDDSEDR